ncbi:MAG TPA: Plug domain-containing protein, partial [Nitrosomonas sp.]|nr:Plug domain-containing protein [Nitrosomonas sp.]
MHTNNATKLHYWCAMLLINLIHMMIRRTTNSFRLSRNIPQRWLILSLVGSCWLSAVAFAQVEDTRKMIRMPELVITSTPFKDRSELNMTQPTSILQGDNLRRKREASLGDTLINEVGVTSSSFGPGAGRPIIRALDGPRIQVLENGIGSLDVSSL